MFEHETWVVSRYSRYALLLSFALASFGCSGDDEKREVVFPTAAVSGGTSGAAAPAKGVTYQKDIRALLETSCLDCHMQGGIGPFPLDTWTSVNTVNSSIANAVKLGLMPPTFWNDDCQPLNENRALTPAQRELFAQWERDGYLEGDAKDYVAPPPRMKKVLGAPTITMSSGTPYTPRMMTDEYRCFVLDSIPDEAYLTGMQILPGQTDEVHHVIIYRVVANALAQARQLDQRDSKPGYACSGGPMVPSQNMFSYRPGSEAVTFDQGDAAYMEAGSSLIIQVHYNTMFLPAGQEPAPDDTKIALWTLPEGVLPERVVYRTTTFGPINIPAGDENVISNISKSMTQLATLSSGALAGANAAGSSFGGFPAPTAPAAPTSSSGMFIPGEVIGMTPHAHQLATEMHASLKHEDGTSTCLDDVKWDFNWQFDYLFEKGVPYTEKDTFKADCVFDNSAANQPIIDGQRQMPRNVQFGERSIDEMCEHYIWLRFERDVFMKARAKR